MLGEAALIERIKALAGRSAEDLVLGIGDDAAIIRRNDEKWGLLSIDTQIENVHFRREYMPPRMLGHKALAVNLSDIAAMGGTPRFALLSLALPRGWEETFVDEMLEGMMALADAHSTLLIGGDITASGDGVMVTVTILGECPAGRAIRRDGARPGDLIYVTGQLGLSAVGLRLLQSGYRYAADLPAHWQRPILAQLQPTPRLEFGQALAEQQLASALIDLSDGLSTDLFHICESSHVGAIIAAERIPMTDIPSELNITALENALNGGEDYELLFTVPVPHRTSLELLKNQFPYLSITQIGEIIDEPGRLLIERDGAREALLPRGHDHLRPA